MQKAGFPVERIKRDWADMGIILCETYKGKRRFTVRKKGKDGTGRRLPYIAIKFKGQRVYQ